MRCLARAPLRSTVALLTLVASNTSAAADAIEPAPRVPRELDRWILDDARRSFAPAQAGELNVDIHGELQFRANKLTVLPLPAPISAPTLTTLGQEEWASAWTRFTGHFTVGESISIVLQADVVPNWIMGDTTQGVGASGDYARDDSTPTFGRLRYAYVDWTSPIGLFRVGQVGAQWGLGLVANDGDHARLFGDYFLGSIVDEIAYATRPLGKSSPFVVAIAGNLVQSDATASWGNGDRTYQLVGSAFYRDGHDFAGLYGVRRWQTVGSDPSGVSGRFDLWVVDASAKTAQPLGPAGLFGFVGVEAAGIFGTTTAIRTSPAYPQQDVRTFGGLARLGVVKSKQGRDGVEFGQLVAQLDAGWASNDADPYDGTVKQFTSEPNAAPGLLLFPTVMNFLSARAATNALDPQLAARPFPGVDFLASKGGFFGAEYLYPSIVWRPAATFDLKAALLVAVATGDVVDPYTTVVTGSARSYRGAAPTHHDLGVELDYGFEWRTPLSPAATLQVGGQAGILFPGHALDDAKGKALPTQATGQARIGVQF